MLPPYLSVRVKAGETDYTNKSEAAVFDIQPICIHLDSCQYYPGATLIPC